jgi:hypothetical protein
MSGEICVEIIFLLKIKNYGKEMQTMLSTLL